MSTLKNVRKPYGKSQRSNMIASAQLIRTKPEAIRAIERSLKAAVTSPFDGHARTALADAVQIAGVWGLNLAQLAGDLKHDIKRRFAPPSGCAVGVVCDHIDCP